MDRKMYTELINRFLDEKLTDNQVKKLYSYANNMYVTGRFKKQKTSHNND